MNYSSGILEMDCLALSPISHGAGTSGNTQLFRMEPVIFNGKAKRVPMISGNSIKHMIRESSVRWALDAMGVEDGTLSKDVIYLLFSGGKLSSGGGVIDISKARELAKMFPALTLCGYSAGNFMTASKINVSSLRLVCAENSIAVPESMRERPEVALKSAAYMAEEFGTRHDPLRTVAARRMLTDSDAAMDDVARSTALKKKQKGGLAKKQKDTLQMIYDFQVVKPGSRWWGDIRFTDVSDLELAALRSALEYACVGEHPEGMLFHFGARSSLGFGKMAITFRGSMREPIRPPTHNPTDLPVPTRDESSLSTYAAHLADNKDDILSMLGGMV